ncbi:hypothetical protein B296_00030780 [Ensete ventricosum]|uniref:Uncharacterized protein n=1 Tax=Ensete ventricosum TaxID=4639 RepID=A0A426ZN19_ENSVE|nr:hypothetical protein B296_00030780 [Ensete ventricosum]
MYRSNKGSVWVARFAISICTTRYGRYIPVRQVTSTRTARYWSVPQKIDRRRPIEGEIDHRQSIEGEKGKKKKKRERRKKKKRKEKKDIPSIVLARGSLVCHCRPRPLFLPREKMKRLPARGERSRRHRRAFHFVF